MESIIVKCCMNGSDVTNFTDGKLYRATKPRPDLAVYEIKDDNGHVKVILPGEKSPHLVRQTDFRGWRTQKPVGVFEVVTPEFKCIESEQFAAGHMLPMGTGWRAEDHGTWRIKGVGGMGEFFRGSLADCKAFVERIGR